MTRKLKLKLPENWASESIYIHLTEDERAEIKRRAKAHNLSISGYARAAALAHPVYKRDKGELKRETTKVIVELGKIITQQYKLCKSDPKNACMYHEIIQAAVDAITAVRLVKKNEKVGEVISGHLIEN